MGSCVARVNPAMARLGKPTVVVDIDGTVPDGWYADIAACGVPPPWWRELDELIATLSYDGWQDDVAVTKAVCLQGMRRMRHKCTTAGLRGQGGRCRWTRSKTRPSNCEGGRWRSESDEPV